MARLGEQKSVFTSDDIRDVEVVVTIDVARAREWSIAGRKGEVVTVRQTWNGPKPAGPKGQGGSARRKMPAFRNAGF